jgi:hypothetical protein
MKIMPLLLQKKVMKAILRLVMMAALLAAYVYSNANNAAHQLRFSPSGLNYLKAELVNDVVYLEWASDPAHKCSYYIVERSIDALEFEEIAIVFEGGNGKTVYNLKDSPESEHVYYYRLRPIASEKNSGYSNMVMVDYKLPMLDFNIYPNPTRGNLTFNYGLNENESGEVLISDLAGNALLSYKLEVFTNKLVIDDTRLERGTYFYSYRKNGSTVKSGKLIIVN